MSKPKKFPITALSMQFPLQLMLCQIPFSGAFADTVYADSASPGQNKVRIIRNPLKCQFNIAVTMLSTGLSKIILVKISKNTPFEIPVILTVKYGLRRSEVLGLRWQDIDFENETIHICHTAIKSPEKLTYVDNTKSETSKRILPLFDDIKEFLLILKRRQEIERNVCKSEYYINDYICKWSDGHPITPDYISRNFKVFLRKNDLPEIRFHDIRHSVATYVVSLDIPIEAIKNWLGHSDISTTEIYIHLGYNTNLQTKNAMEQALSIAI